MITRGKSYPIESIWIDREKRQRRELTNIDELASSISRTGLVHPITITADGELVAGERRLSAAKQLGWTSIDVQFVEDLDPVALQVLELEENIARVDLPWQDNCRAVQRYHKLRCSEDPTWTQAKTADALNMSRTAVTQKIGVIEELDNGNKLIAAAPTYSAASGIAARATERKKYTGLLKANLAIAPEKAQSIMAKETEIPLLHADFTEWVENYSGPPKFNFIHCDFPYGVGMHKSDQGAGKSFGTYEDTPKVYWRLVADLSLAMDKIISPQAHLMFWFSMDFYELTRLSLEKMGWKVNPFPLIWHKSDNAGILPDHNRGPRRIYETAFIASRGDRLIVKATSNVKSFPSAGKEIHSNQKPIAMLQQFFSMFVDESTVMLDPTCGSASALKAAKIYKPAEVLGIEKDFDFFTLACEHYHNEQF